MPFGDAACVALCRTANAVILGKTVTTEFANRHPGPTTNPHNAGPHAGRLVVGLGRRGGRRPCAARLRHADRRLGDPPRRLLRRDRLQADLRRLLARRHQDAMPFGRHAGPDGAHARRHRAVPRRRAQAAAGQDRSRHRPAAHRLLPHADLGRGLARHQGAAGGDGQQARRQGRVGGRRRPLPRPSPTSSTTTPPSPAGRARATTPTSGCAIPTR